MSLSRLRARLDSAVYGQPGNARLAEEATWNGVRVTVTTADPEQVVGLGESDFIVPSMLIKVPRAQVTAPTEGDMVVIGEMVDDTFTAIDTYTVTGTPRLNAGHEWVCEAARA